MTITHIVIVAVSASSAWVADSLCSHRLASTTNTLKSEDFAHREDEGDVVTNQFLGNGNQITTIIHLGLDLTSEVFNLLGNLLDIVTTCIIHCRFLLYFQSGIVLNLITEL